MSFELSTEITQASHPDVDTELLAFIEMLTYMRPAGSKTEREFIAKFIKPLGAEPDNFGNYWVVVGDSKVLWSSHTDTVHKAAGKQTILYSDDTGRLSTKEGSCLGADCTTGVWLMRQMILARVPGVYVFHRGEEVGGNGSKGIRRVKDKRLAKVKFAIAFDRKGVSSVITHQNCERTASQAFVDSIVDMLPGQYKADDGGTFTDTANYSDWIPECTNISVGYYDQHTKTETQDLEHAIVLADAMKKFDENKLVAARDPSKTEWLDDYDYRSGGIYGFGGYGGYAGRTLHGDYTEYYSAFEKGRAVVDRPGWDTWLEGDYPYATKGDNRARYDSAIRRPRSLYELCRDYPEEVADYLEASGCNVEEICDYADI